MGTKIKSWGPGLLLISPSLLLLSVFVYGFIALSFRESLTDKHTAGQATGQAEVSFVGLENYAKLLSSPAFQHSLRNLVVFTVVFLLGTLLIGFCWAWLLERPIKGEGIFRSVYLFPMAVSFVAAGVVWRWLLSPAKGEGAIGLNQLLSKVGLDGLQSSWWSGDGRFTMAAMAMPAIWQLSGYIMALFLAGFRGISDDQREAARIDGASEWQVYRHVLFPQLSPIALSALIILGHMSMKMFDLIYAIAGPNSYAASVPATLMWTQMFAQDDRVAAAVNATILLVIVAVVVVPYLIYTNKTESERD